MSEVFSNAQWLTTPWPQDDTEHPRRNPIFRKTLDLPQAAAAATLAISGLGHYELYINGTRVGDRYLEPAFTDYDKRVLYSTYDVGDLLTKGENVFALYLGRGRYNMNTVSVWCFEKAPWRAPCAFIIAGNINTASGQTIPLDGSGWTCTEGPIYRDSMYGGEGFDARLEPEGWQHPGFNDSNWDTAVPAQGPSGSLQPSDFEPIRIVKRVPVATTVYSGEDRVVYDFGDMIAGNVEIRVQQPAGTTLHITYTEKCEDTQVICPQEHVSGGFFQEDDYVCCGEDEEIWHARFSYKGFRYVEIKGFSGKFAADQVTALVMHNDVKPRGYFECSNPFINKLHQTCTTALLNNLHHVVTDTPTFEKNGWTGDAQLTTPMGLYNFELEAFYRNFTRDMVDSQTDEGEVAPIVPTSGWGLRDNPNSKWDKVTGVVPAWDAALFIMTWEIYQFSGDLSIIKENYPAMQKYLTLLSKGAVDYIVDAGLGDWLPPNGNPDDPKPGEPSEGPSISSTAWFYKLTGILHQCAVLLEHAEEQQRCSDLLPAIHTAFNTRFLNEAQDGYESGKETEYRQTSNILALAFGLVPDAYKACVFAALKQDICKDGSPRLNTGILGTRYVFDVLADNGEVDLAWQLMTTEDYPSWGFWFANGFVSLGEMWELTSRSWSHHMFGSVDAWFYRYLAGIKPAVPGYAEITIAPHIPADLDAFTATLELSQGTLTSSYHCEDKKHVFDITLPGACTGNFTLPAGLPEVRLENHYIKAGYTLAPGTTQIVINNGGDVTLTRA